MFKNEKIEIKEILKVSFWFDFLSESSISMDTGIRPIPKADSLDDLKSLWPYDK